MRVVGLHVWFLGLWSSLAEAAGIISSMFPGWRSSRSIFFAALCASLVMGLAAYRSTQSTRLVVEWQTSSEVGIVGYNLYRSTHPQGEYSLVNIHLVPASGQFIRGGSYTYHDRGEPGQVYYYLLEEVDSDGGMHRNGPIEVKSASPAVLWMGLSAACLSLAAWSLWKGRNGGRFPLAQKPGKG